MVLFLALNVAFWRDQMIGNQQRQVVINPQPGKVVHADISESAIVTTAYPVTFAPEPMAIVSDPANLYAGPAPTYAVIGAIRSGEMRRIIQRTSAGDYLQICCVQGQIAWIESARVQVDGDTSSIPIYIDLTHAVTK